MLVHIWISSYIFFDYIALTLFMAAFPLHHCYLAFCSYWIDSCICVNKGINVLKWNCCVSVLILFLFFSPLLRNSTAFSVSLSFCQLPPYFPSVISLLLFFPYVQCGWLHPVKSSNPVKWCFSVNKSENH